MGTEEMGAKITEMLVAITKLQEEMKSTWKRIDEQKSLVETVHELALSVRDLANAQANTAGVVASLRKDVDELRDKPAKRWESVVGFLLSGIIGAVIAYTASQAGIK